jgi:hypothetical protein
MPKQPAPIVGPSDQCSCGTSKPRDLPRCTQCWTLHQVVGTHAVRLLRNPKTAPAVRELLEAALSTKPESTETA